MTMGQVVAMGEADVRGRAPSDADLWRAVAGADAPAFRELFVRHADAVYNYCFRRTASWSAAEDAVQSTFATVWRRAVAGQVDDLRLGSARPVLFAMARNECSNANRSRARQVALIDRVGVDVAGSIDQVDRWVESESTMREIRAALTVLPANQRDVIELVAWSELSMAETAAALGISVGTVKSRLARARVRLASSRIADLLGDHR